MQLTAATRNANNFIIKVDSALFCRGQQYIIKKHQSYKHQLNKLVSSCNEFFKQGASPSALLCQSKDTFFKVFILKI